MIDTLNTYQIADRLFRDENAGFSYNGAKALAEYLDTEENAMMEFDSVAIRCEWSEYTSAVAAWQEYDPSCQSSGDEDEDEAEALALLQDKTTVISFDGGIIIAQF